MGTKRKFIVTEVPGRRWPWRVHAPKQDPRSAADSCHVTREEAEAAAREANQPHRVLDIRIPGLNDFVRRLAGRR